MSNKQERLKAEEETVVNHLTLCIKSGCSIDWVDVCREAGLFPGVAKLVEETYGRHHGLSTVSSSSVVSSLKVRRALVSTCFVASLIFFYVALLPRPHPERRVDSS